MFREENVLEERAQVGKISIRKVFVRNYPGKKTFGKVLNSRKSGDNPWFPFDKRQPNRHHATLKNPTNLESVSRAKVCT